MVSFYGEGGAEYGFLAPVVVRTLEQLIPYVDVLRIDLNDDDLNSRNLPQQDKIMRMAEEAGGLIIFHLDADAPDTRRAYRERFRPGYDLVLESPRADLNRSIVPIIPVRNTEAWMLVDFNAFQEAVGTNLSARDLGFVNHPRQVESIQAPKEVFRQAVTNARPGKRKSIDVKDVYGPLAPRIDLELLKRVPAFQLFRQRLIDALRSLYYDV